MVLGLTIFLSFSSVEFQLPCQRFFHSLWQLVLVALLKCFGAITKRMTAIKEMVGMDVFCSDKTGTLTLNKLTVEKNLVEVFAKGVDADTVVLMAAQASRTENQDAIDTAIVGMLSDPKEARAGICEIHFLPFNPTDNRTTLTYLDGEGKMHRVSKGAPEQFFVPRYGFRRRKWTVF